MEINEDRILKINIENEMKTSYIDYSMSVIVSRALPDVRDGFKPVHRRVLYGMEKMGVFSNSAHKKSARIVGDVMGKYHPHGDSSIYLTMVRLAQDWALRCTLVDGQGNFGSIDGDSPAAMRYTEARLSKIGEEMLRDIDEETVDFAPNYDGTTQEPTVLPTRFPNLLVNGASGIAVGMATNMAPHNLTESINASIALLLNPDMTVAELMQHITAPDFPTGGIIYGYSGVKEAFETGKGRIVIRSKCEIETSGEHEKIVITEIPYNVNRRLLIESIAQLVIDRKIEGISNVNDESGRAGMRIVVDIKRDANANVVLNKLFKMTQMQSSFSVNNVALVNGRPRLLNLKELLQHFLNHRHDVVIRRTQFRKRKAEERAHIVAGLIIACDNIDEVVKIIRGSKTTDDARAELSARFGLDEVQTKAIVDMRLSQLTNLGQDKLHGEYDELMQKISEYNLILTDSEVCRQLIITELEEVRDKYGEDRRTQIEYSGEELNAEDFYADDPMIITVSHMGYIKRTPLNEFRTQGRGGVGAKGSDTRDSDFIESVYQATNHNYMLFFTQKGRCYWLRVFEIPEGSKNSKGRAIQNMLNIEADDKITAYLRVVSLSDPDYNASHNIVFATKRGVVKKTSLADYSRPRLKGINAININEGDSVIGVVLTEGDSQIILANRNGRAVRFEESKVRVMGRTATGVRGMELDDENDEVVGMICMRKGSNDSVLVVSEQGFGKRSDLDDYRVTNRGTKGVKTINITEKTGKLVSIRNVNDSNDLVIINKSGITIRIKVSDLRIMGRATQGVRLINLGKNNDEIASVCKVSSMQDIEGEEELPNEGMPYAEPTNDGDNYVLNLDDDSASNNQNEVTDNNADDEQENN